MKLLWRRTYTTGQKFEVSKFFMFLNEVHCARTIFIYLFLKMWNQNNLL